MRVDQRGEFDTARVPKLACIGLYSRFKAIPWRPPPNLTGRYLDRRQRFRLCIFVFTAVELSQGHGLVLFTVTPTECKAEAGLVKGL